MLFFMGLYIYVFMLCYFFYEYMVMIFFFYGFMIYDIIFYEFMDMILFVNSCYDFGLCYIILIC
jgi:hypothetical protein